MTETSPGVFAPRVVLIKGGTYVPPAISTPGYPQGGTWGNDPATAGTGHLIYDGTSYKNPNPTSPIPGAPGIWEEAVAVTFIPNGTTVATYIDALDLAFPYQVKTLVTLPAPVTVTVPNPANLGDSLGTVTFQTLASYPEAGADINGVSGCKAGSLTCTLTTGTANLARIWIYAAMEAMAFDGLDYQFDPLVENPDTKYILASGAYETHFSGSGPNWPSIQSGELCNQCHNSHSGKPRIIKKSLIEAIAVRGINPYSPTGSQIHGFNQASRQDQIIAQCAQCHSDYVGGYSANTARDPIFRANEIIVNSALQSATGQDGGGNMCFRCHSPNGWYSGRFDPALNGSGDGSQMLHSILLSTDDEGIPCEMCHRAIGAVTYKRADLDPNDPVWNLMAGIDDWPHSGNPFVDQEGDLTLAEGNPYGNASLQFADGMMYVGRYPGTANIYMSDLPLVENPTAPGGYSVGGDYTGQTYGVYPPGWIDIWGNDIGGQPAIGLLGELLIQLDVPAGVPLNPNGTPCYQCQSVSPEHSTAMYPNSPPGKAFIQTSEFCGACHKVTIPILNHGMPEQRTYTEWKYSAYSAGAEAKTCQDCHMPRLSHEYSDAVTGSFNSDPYGEPGGWPYSKTRTNTAVHKLAGANRDLPMIMKELYPEVDIEVGGEGAGGFWVGTGNDPRIFPGMLSNRDSMWDRNQRNTEIMMQDGVDVEISQAPTLVDATNGIWEVKVKVINNTGHRVPSGYPDGRRLWINLAVKDGNGKVVYQSGYYDSATATLHTDASPQAGLQLAQSPVIDATATGSNAVMIYQRITGACNNDDVTACTPSLDVLNDFILFDNRIPPRGFDYSKYRQSGVKFWNYDPATFVPYEEYNSATGQSTRYPNGRNWDEVTYRFTADPSATLSVRAEALWQTHTREFMEHLRENDNSTVRPEGPPRPWSANYPLEPNYLSDEFGLAEVSAELELAGFITEPLRDNWGGLSYAVWHTTGMGAPYPVAVADTTAALPAQVTGVRVSPASDPVTGACVGGMINPATGVIEAYTQTITWDAVAGAEGYRVWIRYGVGATAASWDKLAIVLGANNTQLVNTAINVNKSYTYKVEAFNGAGYGPASVEVIAKTPWDLPLLPENLRYVNSGPNWIQMSWYDGSDNETKWLVFRADAAVGATLTKIAEFPSTTGFGGVSFTDGDFTQVDVIWGNPTTPYTPPVLGKCYNYVVEAANSAGSSGWNVNGPVQMCTQGPPNDPTALSAVAVNAYQVDLAWTDNAGTENGFRVERALDAAFTTGLTTFNVARSVAVAPAPISYTDNTVAPATTYYYRVFAYNGAGDSQQTTIVNVTTPDIPPAVPSAPGPNPPTVTLTWTDNANNEQGFTVERAPDNAGVPGTFAVIAPSVAANTTTYVDSGVAPKATYWYRVRAYNAIDASPYTLSVSVVTPGEVPQAPSNLRVSDRTRNSITIRWRDNATNETGFYVERSLNGGATWIRIAALPRNTTRFINTGLTRNTTYWYRVQAYNADGVSGYSGTVAGTTRR